MIRINPASLWWQQGSNTAHNFISSFIQPIFGFFLICCQRDVVRLTKPDKNICLFKMPKLLTQISSAAHRNR